MDDSPTVKPPNLLSAGKFAAKKLLKPDAISQAFLDFERDFEFDLEATQRFIIALIELGADQNESFRILGRIVKTVKAAQGGNEAALKNLKKADLSLKNANGNPFTTEQLALQFVGNVQAAGSLERDEIIRSVVGEISNDARTALTSPEFFDERKKVKVQRRELLGTKSRLSVPIEMIEFAFEQFVNDLAGGAVAERTKRAAANVNRQEIERIGGPELVDKLKDRPVKDISSVLELARRIEVLDVLIPALEKRSIRDNFVTFEENRSGEANLGFPEEFSRIIKETRDERKLAADQIKAFTGLPVSSELADIPTVVDRASLEAVREKFLGKLAASEKILAAPSKETPADQVKGITEKDVEALVVKRTEFLLDILNKRLAFLEAQGDAERAIAEERQAIAAPAAPALSPEELAARLDAEFGDFDAAFSALSERITTGFKMTLDDLVEIIGVTLEQIAEAAAEAGFDLKVKPTKSRARQRELIPGVTLASAPTFIDSQGRAPTLNVASFMGMSRYPDQSGSGDLGQLLPVGELSQAFEQLGGKAGKIGVIMLDMFKTASTGAGDLTGVLGGVFDALGGIGGKAGRLIGIFANLFGGGGFGSLLGSLGGILGKAGGGTVQPGIPTLVGERGPELFIPCARRY